MIDINFIRENREIVERNNRSRNVEIDLADLLSLDNEKNRLQQEIDNLRAERNKRSKTKPTEEEIKLMRKLGEEVSGLEELAAEKQTQLEKILQKIPNLNHESTPVGADESGNKIERTVGEQPIFNFTPQEHQSIPSIQKYLDLERGAKLSGSRFYYLKGKLANLERALMQFALDTIQKKGFELVLPPIPTRMTCT
jgi:seryl-tRNA synthetase